MHPCSDSIRTQKGRTVCAVPGGVWSLLKQLFSSLSVLGSDQPSPVHSSIPPVPVPLTAPPTQSSPHSSQSPLILQPLASPLQVGVPPMPLPIILNPALIEATSPVPLLPGPRPTSPSDEVK